MPVADLEVRMEIKGLKEAQKELERIARELSGPPMVKAIRTATLMVERDAKKLTPVNTGRLRASITPVVLVRGKQVQGVVGTNVKYAAAVEFGSKPHTPPFDAILRWVQLKGIAGTYSIRTRKRLGAKTQRQSQDVAAAGAIWSSIRKRGTKAHPYFQPAWDKNAPRIERMITGVVGRIVKGK